MKKICSFRKKKVKVNPSLLFFQTLMGQCPKYCIPRSKAIDPSVLQKQILKVFLPNMGMAAILIM